MKTLVCGWFSFESMGASAGDVLVRDLACDWLAGAGRDYDVALAPPFEGGVDWRTADPRAYEEVLFVCGPFGNGPPLTEFLERFSGRRLVGLNLTMLEPVEDWDPTALLIERDSSREARPDLAFLSDRAKVPVVGVVLIDSQPEYGARDLHVTVDEAIEALLSSRELAVVRIDTRLDVNATELRTAGEVESLIARMDAVVTTRLHGLVLAIKNGVPALAVDTVAGGAKVSRQAEVLGWPIVLTPEDLDGDVLGKALHRCLSPEARDMARACSERARARLASVRDELLRSR
jgi:hypothetical protein